MPNFCTLFSNAPLGYLERLQQRSFSFGESVLSIWPYNCYPITAFLTQELCHEMISHVFISGAQSVGKTTLVRKLREVLNYQCGKCIVCVFTPHLDFSTVLSAPVNIDIHISLVEEAARRVILEDKLTKDDLNPRLNPVKCQALNLKLLKINSNAVYEHRNENSIFDRGLDPLVYANFYLGKQYYEELLRTTEAQRLIESCKKCGTIFIIYPHSECIVDDEIRLSIDLDELKAFTVHMTEIFTALNVKWTCIKMLDLNERTALVLDTLGKS